MDWLTLTNYHMSHYQALHTPNLACVTSQTSYGSHICIHNREDCSCTCAECTSWVVLVNTWARSCAEAFEWDLLVAYLDINICVSLQNACCNQGCTYKDWKLSIMTQVWCYVWWSIFHSKNMNVEPIVSCGLKDQWMIYYQFSNGAWYDELMADYWWKGDQLVESFYAATRNVVLWSCAPALILLDATGTPNTTKE